MPEQMKLPLFDEEHRPGFPEEQLKHSIDAELHMLEGYIGADNVVLFLKELIGKYDYR